MKICKPTWRWYPSASSAIHHFQTISCLKSSLRGWWSIFFNPYLRMPKTSPLLQSGGEGTLQRVVTFNSCHSGIFDTQRLVEWDFTDNETSILVRVLRTFEIDHPRDKTVHIRCFYVDDAPTKYWHTMMHIPYQTILTPNTLFSLIFCVNVDTTKPQSDYAAEKLPAAIKVL